jgi:predicted amidohydrolase
MSSINITTIQTNLHWEDKSSNLANIENKIKSSNYLNNIVILPEMFSTGFSMNASTLAETMEGESVSWMKRVAKENKIILTGSLIIQEENNFFNRLIWMLPNGEFGYYDKRHLFGFAEEDKFYTAGNKRFITSVNGWRFNLQICYDLRFPVWARQQSKSKDDKFTPEYDVLVYVANWPARRSHAWKSLLIARAIENQCYVIGVNRVGNDGKDIYHSGDTTIIDPMGEILYHKADEEDVFTISLNKENIESVHAKLPFLKDADMFFIQPDGE